MAGPGPRAHLTAVGDDEQMSGLVQRNIRALVEVRQAQRRRRSRQLKVADAVTRFTGSMPFVYLHAAIAVLWFVVNLGLVPWVKPFDPYPFVMLAMAASVEAIFLSTFVLISQNQMARATDERAELDLQISLLAEHELTQLIKLTEEIGRRVGVVPGEDLASLKKDVKPEEVLEEISELDKSH
jgi:uncharacterized membrane protein